MVSARNSPAPPDVEGKGASIKRSFNKPLAKKKGASLNPHHAKDSVLLKPSVSSSCDSNSHGEEPVPFRQVIGSLPWAVLSSWSAAVILLLLTRIPVSNVYDEIVWVEGFAYLLRITAVYLLASSMSHRLRSSSIDDSTLFQRRRRQLAYLYEKTVQVIERITATLVASASSLRGRVVEILDAMEMQIIYMSGFEAFSKGILFLLGEGCGFDRNKLIQLWMANPRFLRYERMEIICATHFEKLVSEGYILYPPKMSSLYKVNSEKVNSYFNTNRRKSNYLKLGSRDQSSVVAFGDALHISVLGDHNANEEVLSTLKEFHNLRTLLFLGNYGSRLELRDLCLNYEILTILDLSGTPIKELPSTIGSMPSLRYLDLSWTFIEILPETTENFRGIETLRLIGCSRLVRLPREMKRLIQLRHLDLDVVGQLSSMPREMGVLTNLRTLPGFIVGTEEGCKITELSGLNSLTGELRIARLENVLSAIEAKKASLGDKPNLRKLELRWTDSLAQEAMTTEDDGVLENLRPHSNLEELRILCYNGANLPAWIADESFGMLMSITLIRCAGLSCLPPFSMLPSLESLELYSINSVAVFDCGLGVWYHVAFPKLKKLIIGEMHSLEGWIEKLDGDWASLVELTIMDCPKLTQVPSLVYLPSIQRVEISCCQQLSLMPQKELSASVEVLIIDDCPLISERCSMPDGQDWCLIKHVRNVWIDQEPIHADDEDSSEVLDQDDYLESNGVIEDDENS